MIRRDVTYGSPGATPSRRTQVERVELAQQAAVAPAMAKLRAVVDFVGSGRPSDAGGQLEACGWGRARTATRSEQSGDQGHPLDERPFRSGPRLRLCGRGWVPGQASDPDRRRTVCGRHGARPCRRMGPGRDRVAGARGAGRFPPRLAKGLRRAPRRRRCGHACCNDRGGRPGCIDHDRGSLLEAGGGWLRAGPALGSTATTQRDFTTR